jgi:hypothetical protein
VAGTGAQLEEAIGYLTDAPDLPGPAARLIGASLTKVLWLVPENLEEQVPCLILVVVRVDDATPATAVASLAVDAEL